MNPPDYSNGGRRKPEQGRIRAYGIDDVGTRAEHLLDLYDIWGCGLEILTRPNLWHNSRELEQAQELKVALKYLMHHMEAGAPNVVHYAVVINNLPKNPPASQGGESNYSVT